MNFYDESVLYNSWTEVTMDFLLHEENREETQTILNKIFSFDPEEAKAYRKKGLKRLKELGETNILESIEKRYYLTAGGVRE